MKIENINIQFEKMINQFGAPVAIKWLHQQFLDIILDPKASEADKKMAEEALKEFDQFFAQTKN